MQRCLFCGEEITRERLLFIHEDDAVEPLTDDVRTGFLSGCMPGLTEEFRSPDACERYRRLYFRPDAAYALEEKGGLPVRMSGVPISAGLTPSQLQNDPGTPEVEQPGAEPRLLTLTRRACACCHSELPEEFGAWPVIRIGVCGAKGSGKTTFLAKLAERIVHDDRCGEKGRLHLAQACRQYAALLRAHASGDRQLYAENAGSGDCFPLVLSYVDEADSANNRLLSLLEITHRIDSTDLPMARMQCDNMLLMIDCHQLRRIPWAMLTPEEEEGRETAYPPCTKPIDEYMARMKQSFFMRELLTDVVFVAGVLARSDEIVAPERDRIRREFCQGTLDRELHRQIQRGFESPRGGKPEVQLSVLDEDDPVAQLRQVLAYHGLPMDAVTAAPAPKESASPAQPREGFLQRLKRLIGK